MLDHVGIAATDVARPIASCEWALASLGIRRLMTHGGSKDVPDRPGPYGAFVLDPDGCDPEAVRHSFD